jgi:hypothetical protein
MDRPLAWHGFFLCRSRLPAVVGEEESDKIAAIVALAFFTSCGGRKCGSPRKLAALFGSKFGEAVWQGLLTVSPAVSDDEAELTVTDCYAAYVEFCNQHGRRALTRNKFGAVIGDTVVHQFGITTRHDVPDDKGKEQRGWKGIRLQRNLRE